MPRQHDLDAGAPQRCFYAHRPDQRPHCQHTAVVRYSATALCTDCQTRRSTLGKGQRPHPLLAPTAPDKTDTIQAITHAEQHLRHAHTELAAAVRRARTQGHSWITIAATLNITRQAAQQRFSKDQHREG